MQRSMALLEVDQLAPEFRIGNFGQELVGLFQITLHLRVQAALVLVVVRQRRVDLGQRWICANERCGC